jgi:hypothetical protein
MPSNGLFALLMIIGMVISIAWVFASLSFFITVPRLLREIKEILRDKQE